MKNFIEFKLHNGQVPYFAENTFSIPAIDNRFYGISKDDKPCYLPDNIVKLTEQAFKDKLYNDGIIMVSDGLDGSRELTGQEKIDYIAEWVIKNF